MAQANPLLEKELTMLARLQPQPAGDKLVASLQFGNASKQEAPYSEGDTLDG
jgi:hypothetical protein